MGISFKDSLNASKSEPAIDTYSVAPLTDVNGISAPAALDYDVASLIENSMLVEAYSGEETWAPDATKYEYYDQYSDENTSTIDSLKNVSVHESQINITQEENSQYIPFQMDRKYDGFDLNQTTLMIYFVNAAGNGDYAPVINYYFSDDKIKFGWLVNKYVTAMAGKISFEIHAVGSFTTKSGKKMDYLWKTKPCDTLNVLESLSGGKMIEPDHTWVTSFLTQINESVAVAQAAVNAAAAQASLAREYANSAAEAANAAQDAVDSAKEELAETIDDKIDSEITETFKNYYTIDQVDELFDNFDISSQLTDLEKEIDDVRDVVDNMDGLAAFGVEYVEPKLTFYNDTVVIGEVEISSNPTDEWTTTYTSEIEEKISTAKNELQNNINTVDAKFDDYYKKTETYTSGQIDEKLRNIDLAGYATTDALAVVSGNTVANAEKISGIESDITSLQSSLSTLEGDNENLIVQYSEIGSTLYLYEKDKNGDITITDGEEQIKVKQLSSTIITGAGGGGNSLVSTIKLSLRVDGENTSTVLFGNDVSLHYTLSTRTAQVTQDENGDDVTTYVENVIPGNITLAVYKDNVYVTQLTVKKTSKEVQSGSIDVSDYVSLGSQIFTIKASYIETFSDSSETITIRSSADWSVNTVNLAVTGLPDSTWETTPKYGATAISYTPIGALEKTIYFQIDDKTPDTVVTSLNGTSLPYTIPMQTHGVHTLKVWCSGVVGETTISTDPYEYVLMFVEAENKEPIIRIKAPTKLEQYSTGTIYYNILDPSNSIIKFASIYDEDGMVLSSVQNITSAEQKFEFRPSVAKNKTITIQYGDYSESVEIEITEFPYEINAVTGDLMVDFIPTGRSNLDVDYDVFKNNAYTVEKDGETGVEIKTEIPVTWTLSDNFDWINGGWKTDENGDAYFCVKAGTSVDINYNLFGTEGVVAKKDVNGQYTIAGTGKEFKLIFKTTNVAQANATWLECMDTADNSALGIKMEAQNAYIDSSLGTLEIPYVDNDIIEFDMNIVPVTKFLDDGSPNLKVKEIPMVVTYEDGTPVQPKVISAAYINFKQDAPKPISIGSKYCDVHIYRMKVYERYLNDKEILSNFIADARSGAEMADRYARNDIYPVEDKQKITPESVAAACPDLKVYILSAPYFTNDKGDKVENTTIQQIHNTGTRKKPEYAANENWKATNATHNGQGTSSNEYGYSGRNLEFNMKNATITLNDNMTVVKNIQLSPTSYPTNYLNFKINIASSENANNALLQKRYDRYLPYTTIASLLDDRKKNSMEFFNCVVFIQETNEDLSTHREFSDTDIHFYGIGNIGDSKKTDSSRVNDENDANEFCVEIMDWNRYLSSFPTDTKFSTLYTGEDGKTYLRFEEFLVDSNLGEDGILFEKDAEGNYYHSTDTTVDKTKTYYVDILENDDFSEDYTYGFRYIRDEWDKEDDPNYKEKNEAFQRPLRQKWIEFYRFITRNLPEIGEDGNLPPEVKAWKSEFSNWFILDSALYYYLYTLRYTMVDNRAKNTFLHWGKYYLTFEEALAKGIAVYNENRELIADSSNLPSRFYDANGNEIKNINEDAAKINDGYRMEFWAYDNDTALGIDNAGKLEIPFGVEEDDVDAAGVPYFRAHDSLLFKRISSYFVDELETEWHNTEINKVGKVFSSTSFIDEFDVWQGEFPEELWRLDYERKYKRTYVGGTGKDWDYALPQSNNSSIASSRFLTEMMNGRKKHQRRCFERNQEIYMSSKFKGEVNREDTITLRGTGAPTGKVVAPDFTMTVTPFTKMYINLYNATDNIYYHKKCEAGTPTPAIAYPGSTLDFIYVRGASQMQSIGDLSPKYLQTAELGAGSKLKTITLGNATEGYSNDSLKTLDIGAGNKLLEELDIRNLSSLNNTVLPVTSIPSLKRVYAQGSNISSAAFANNGLLEEAYLPSTITRLELRNLYYLKTLELESYSNLLYLVVENCPTVNDQMLDMINEAQNLQTLRAINIDWNFDDTVVLERLYELIKTPSSPEVMLTGKVYVSKMQEHNYNIFKSVWPDLEISWMEWVPQHPVTFVNYDGTVLEVQYVDNGGYVVYPTIIPTKESSDQYDYEFAGWDPDNLDEIKILGPRTVTATYTERIRTYKIKYVMPSELGGAVLDEYEGEYGSCIPYQKTNEDGTLALPYYNDGESVYSYYLFDRWDQSGYIYGDKIVTAIFSSYSHRDETFFDDKELKDLKPVEIYAITKLIEAQVFYIDPTDYYIYRKDSAGNAVRVVDEYDEFTLKVGNDVEYPDIPSEVVIGTPMSFHGNNHYETDIKLFDEDKDFVLAIDYELNGGQSSGVLMQCWDDTKTSGLKLSYDTSKNVAQFAWGSTVMDASAIDNREILILRHQKGSNKIDIYCGNMTGSSVTTTTLSRSQAIIGNGCLRFGCDKSVADGFISKFATGTVYWCKIWYKDLGEDACKNLALWTHEEVTMRATNARRFKNSSGVYTSITLVADHILDNLLAWRSVQDNTGGWAVSDINTILNTKFYPAIPLNYRSIIKKVIVSSMAGNSSYEYTNSECYIAIPAVYDLNILPMSAGNDVNDAHKKEILPAESGIKHFSGADTLIMRRRNDSDAAPGIPYWTRSPRHGYTNRYVLCVNENGAIPSSYLMSPTTKQGVVIMFSV